MNTYTRNLVLQEELHDSLTGRGDGILFGTSGSSARLVKELLVRSDPGHLPQRTLAASERAIPMI